MIAATDVAAATRAAIAAATALPDNDSRWEDAVHGTIRALIHRVAAARDLPLAAYELPHSIPPDAETELDAIGPLTAWTPLDLGDVHQELLRLELTTGHGRLDAAPARGTTRRDMQGSWYTPQPVAMAITRLGLDTALAGLPDGPEQVLRLRAVDPACGAGVLLAEGAQYIAREYARRLAETKEPPPHLVAKVMPEVIYQCVYGVDIDPVAVDLTRTTLWLLAAGRPPFTWLDGNVACLNPLAGPNELPARLLDVMGEPPADTPHPGPERVCASNPTKENRP